MSEYPEITLAIDGLPLLTPEDVPSLDDHCAICLISFRSIFEKEAEGEEGVLFEGEGDVRRGVTKVDGCGHLFCLEDLAQWIQGRHGTCPTCRYPFLPHLQPLDSDDEEESDGGEYVPPDYDAETDFETDLDDFLDSDSDGIDSEIMEVHPIEDGEDLRRERVVEEGEGVFSSNLGWEEQGSSEWGLTDEDSMSASEGEGVFSSNLGWEEQGSSEWGLTDEDSMSASEGEAALGDRPSDPDVQVRLTQDGNYTIDDGAGAPKT